MSRSGLTWLGVAVLLAGLAVFFANPWKDTLHTDPQERPQLYEDFNPGAADRIEIRTAGSEPRVLARDGGAWVVESEGSFPADTTAVGTILRGIRNIVSTGVASTNPRNRSKFQVDSTGAAVTVSGGGQELARFTVGKGGSDFTTSYLRPEGSDDVYVVRGINRNMLTRVQGFRDRTLLRFDEDKVASLELEEPGGGWTLTRGDSTWTLRTGDTETEANQTVAQTIIAVLSRVTADGFLDEEGVDTGLDPPAHRLIVNLYDGSKEILDLGGINESKQYYVSIPGRNVVYLLGEWQVNNFLKSPGELTIPG